ncbi:MAG TPA: hypothetical protein VN455_02225, partial [Methanotrichaceae archaeon]|nr:hypothetical protein [Methanotrichaceae archaeon]
MAELTLWPIRDGDLLELSMIPTSTHWYTSVDENPHDGDVSYLYAPTNPSKTCLFGLTQTNVAGTIANVSVHLSIRGVFGTGFAHVLKTHDTI